MIDAWFGRVLDAIDRSGLWDDTAVILCTDHGHYLGEKDIWGKPAVPIYETLGHIPLLDRLAGRRAAGDVDALTTSVDLFATLADLFGVAVRAPHARPLAGAADPRRARPTACATARSSGVWGREVHLIDGRPCKYARAPVGDERAARDVVEPLVDDADASPAARCGCRCPTSAPCSTACRARRVPVIRQPFDAGDPLPFWAWGDFSGNHLYDLREDPAETSNLAGEAARARRRRCAARRARTRRRAGRSSSNGWGFRDGRVLRWRASRQDKRQRAKDKRQKVGRGLSLLPFAFCLLPVGSVCHLREAS